MTTDTKRLRELAASLGHYTLSSPDRRALRSLILAACDELEANGGGNEGLDVRGQAIDLAAQTMRRLANELDDQGAPNAAKACRTTVDAVMLLRFELAERDARIAELEEFLRKADDECSKWVVSAGKIADQRDAIRAKFRGLREAVVEAADIAERTGAMTVDGLLALLGERLDRFPVDEPSEEGEG